MRTVIQRVRAGSVGIAGAVVSAIGPGLVILVGVGKADTEAQADWLAEKIAHLRIFEDEEAYSVNCDTAPVTIVLER